MKGPELNNKIARESCFSFQFVSQCIQSICFISASPKEEEIKLEITQQVWLWKDLQVLVSTLSWDSIDTHMVHNFYQQQWYS